LVWMECRPVGWSMCLPLLVFPCTIKSRSSVLALAHPGGPGKRVVKRLWCGMVVMTNKHFHKIPWKYGDSVETDKFCGSAQNSMACGKLLALTMTDGYA